MYRALPGEPETRSNEKSKDEKIPRRVREKGETSLALLLLRFTRFSSTTRNCFTNSSRMSNASVPTGQTKSPGLCVVCGTQTSKLCSSCSKAGSQMFFCSIEHQRLVSFVDSLCCSVEWRMLTQGGNRSSSLTSSFVETVQILSSCLGLRRRKQNASNTLLNYLSCRLHLDRFPSTTTNLFPTNQLFPL